LHVAEGTIKESGMTLPRVLGKDLFGIDTSGDNVQQCSVRSAALPQQSVKDGAIGNLLCCVVAGSQVHHDKELSLTWCLHCILVP
jgi:hypothetical protein